MKGRASQKSRGTRKKTAIEPSIDEILDAKERGEAALLENIHANIDSLEKLLEEVSGHWGYEDPVYRFYHQSFKVYYVQDVTRRIIEKLQSLAPALPLNRRFVEILEQGTGKTFSHKDNKNWSAITRPMVEAFLHARFFLEMACKYGRELKERPKSLPSGWAALLYLFNLR